MDPVKLFEAFFAWVEDHHNQHLPRRILWEDIAEDLETILNEKTGD